MKLLLFDCTSHERGISIAHWSLSIKNLEISQDSSMGMWMRKTFSMFEDKKPSMEESSEMQDVIKNTEVVIGRRQSEFQPRQLIFAIEGVEIKYSVGDK